jgi:hypothetical protein
MRSTAADFQDLHDKVESGGSFSRADAERVLASADLISIGLLGEAARRRVSGDTITFGRVSVMRASEPFPQTGPAGELRLLGTVASMDAAIEIAGRAGDLAAGVPLTAFSASDLLDYCGGDRRVLRAAAGRLAACGVSAVAECALDQLGTPDEAIATVQALLEAGLGVWRLTVDRASVEARLDLAGLAAAIQAATGAIRAFAPLPRLDPAEQPATGYDDVRSIAVARLMCRDIPYIQVDWPLYGPKLAQVALAYGANDVDGIAVADTLGLGPRRSPIEEIRRQVLAVAGVPVERNGRFERLR